MNRLNRPAISKSRKTTETDIQLCLCLDGRGKYDISTGSGFMDHMLELFTRHGAFDLSVTCNGDTHIDDHHSIEDIGIVLGQAFLEALGDSKGIKRYGHTILPMDEALILTAVDLCGRSTLVMDVDIPCEKIGDFDTELVEEFLTAFAREVRGAIHVRQLAGKNCHHIVEGIFKSLARSLREAVSVDDVFAEEIPSTKGLL